MHQSFSWRWRLPINTSSACGSDRCRVDKSNNNQTTNKFIGRSNISTRQKQTQKTEATIATPPSSNELRCIIDPSTSGSERFRRWFDLKGRQIPKNLPAEAICNKFQGKTTTKTPKRQHQFPSFSHRLIIDANTSGGKRIGGSFIQTNVKSPQSPSAAATRNNIF